MKIFCCKEGFNGWIKYAVNMIWNVTSLFKKKGFVYNIRLTCSHVSCSICEIKSGAIILIKYGEVLKYSCLSTS